MKPILLTTRATFRNVSVDADKITHVSADPMMNSTVHLIGGTLIAVSESREEVLAAIESASRAERAGANNSPTNFGGVQRLEE